MICYMKVISTLLCLLLLHQNVRASCPKGKMFNHNKKSCEDCPPKLFSNKEGNYCENCSECENGIEVEKCTSTSDTVCKCKKGFTPFKRKTTVCLCEIGFGIDQRGECIQCTEGFFADKPESSCKKWRECKSGIAVQGTSTSDVVCIDPSKEVTEPPKAHATPFQTTKTFSTSTSRTSRTTRTTALFDKTPQHEKSYSLWLVIVGAGVVLLTGLLYYKCKVTRCIQNHKKVDFRKESVCRKPVEESGEKCLSLLV